MSNPTLPPDSNDTMDEFAPGAPPPPEAVAAPRGRQLGEYLLLEVVGEGGFGAVWRAEQPALGRDVAVKILHPHLGARPDLVKRFLREAQLAARLEHPAAAHVYAAGAEPDGTLWIAMEWVRGTPLSAWIAARGPLPLERALPLLERLADVLQAAHDAGIVHRDVKPANVMVSDRGGELHPKLLDFGLARDRGGDGSAPDGPTTSPDASATRAGSAAGTPLYMPPEQWRDVRSAGPAADQYAFAALCFEVLTGAPPFHGTYAELATAHALAPAPGLPAGLPPAIAVALQRALAKAPSDRFPSVRAFAGALRLGAGRAADPAALPHLDPDLRDALLRGAPQPLAEAIAALDSSATAHEALDATFRVARVACRVAGVLALAAHGRTGVELPVAAANLVRDLAGRRLGVAEWTTLATQLVARYAPLRDAFPLPGLVSGWAPVGPVPVVTPAVAARAAGEDVDVGSSIDHDVYSRLERATEALGVLLGALRWIVDTPLVVGGAVPERWTGLRRARRERVDLELVGPALLVDGELLDLAPLVEVAAPAPGAPPELFLLEGAGRQGANLVAWPVGFERRSEAVLEWLGARLPTPIEEDDAPCPYRGLAPFREADADRYVGREREAEAAANRLLQHPFLAVVGPSGVGKSSFVRAGILPRLSETRRIVVRPGPRPVEAIAEFLGADWPEQGHLDGILVVDQLEELVTLCPNPVDRARVGRGLARLADQGTRVVVTLRDDFLARVDCIPGFAGRLAPAIEILRPPDHAALVRILVEPARRSGVRFEDEAVVAAMVDEVEGSPAALPLLSFAASRLWERRDRRLRRIPSVAVAELGGVSGVLARHAEDTIAMFDTAEQTAVRAAFRRLVTGEGTRTRPGRSELLEALPPGAEGVIERLVAARVLVAGGEEGDTLEVAHEALLTSWPRLQRWREEDAEGTRRREELAAAARGWDEHGRAAGYLWHDEAWAELARWLERDPAGLTGREEAFVRASAAHAERRTRRRRAGLIVLFLGLVLLSGTLLVLNRRAEGLRAATAAQVVDGQVELGRSFLLDGQPLRAAVPLVAAWAARPEDRGLRAMLGAAIAPLDALVATLPGHQGGVVALDWDAAGTRIATVDDLGNLRVWDSAGGTLWQVSTGGRPASLDLAPDGNAVLVHLPGEKRVRWWTADGGAHQVVAGEADGAAWDADGSSLLVRVGPAVAVRVDREGHEIARFVAPGAARFAWSDDREAVLATDSEGRVTVWHGDGEPLWAGTFDGPIRFARLGAGGTRLVIVGVYTRTSVRGLPGGAELASVGWANGTSAAMRPEQDFVLLSELRGPILGWDLAAGRERWRRADLGDGAGWAGWVAGDRVIHVGARHARLLDGTTGKDLAVVDTFEPAAHLAAVAPGGAVVAVPDGDGVVRLWDLARLVRPALVETEFLEQAAIDSRGTRFAVNRLFNRPMIDITDLGTGEVRSWQRPEPVLGEPPLAFDPSGELLAVGGVGEGGAVVLGAGDPVPLEPHPGLVSGVAWSPDGRVATASADGVWIHDAATGRVLSRLPAPASIRRIAFSPDGGLLAGGSLERSVYVWKVATGALVHVLTGHRAAVYGVTWSPDGTHLATTASDGTARIWDMGTGTLEQTLSGHETMAFPLVFGPGPFVTTSSSARRTRVWDPLTGRVLLLYPGSTWPLAAEGDTLYLAGDRSLDRVTLPDVTDSVAIIAARVRCHVPLVLDAGGIVSEATVCAER